jgi:hypothetical protein
MAQSSPLASTFPSAALMVVPRDDGKTVSGVLVARDSGYLAAQVQFHGNPVPGLEAQFYFSNDGERGEALGDVVVTDQDGIARAARVVPAGLYVCAVENQADLLIPTVESFEDAYPVVLPVERPYADLNDGLEFAIDDADEADDSEQGSASGGDADSDVADDGDEGNIDDDAADTSIKGSTWE